MIDFSSQPIIYSDLYIGCESLTTKIAGRFWNWVSEASSSRTLLMITMLRSWQLLG
jgi:hypothetical protein